MTIMDIPLSTRSDNKDLGAMPSPSSSELDTLMPPQEAQSTPKTLSSHRPLSSASASQRRKSVSSALRPTRILDIPASPETPRGKKQMTANRSELNENPGSPLRSMPPTKPLKPVISKRSSLSVLTSVLENRKFDDRSHTSQYHARTKTMDGIKMHVHDSLSLDHKNGLQDILSGSPDENNAVLTKAHKEEGFWPVWTRGDDLHPARKKNTRTAPSLDSHDLQATATEIETSTMLDSCGKRRQSLHKGNRGLAAPDDSLRSAKVTKSTLLKPSASANALKAAFTSTPLSFVDGLEAGFAFRGRSNGTNSFQKSETVIRVPKSLLYERIKDGKTGNSLKDPFSIQKHTIPKRNLNPFLDKKVQSQSHDSQIHARETVEQNVASLLAHHNSPTSSTDLSGLGIVQSRSDGAREEKMKHLEDRLVALTRTPMATQRASPSIAALRTPRSMAEGALPRIVVTPPPITVRTRDAGKSEQMNSESEREVDLSRRAEGAQGLLDSTAMLEEKQEHQKDDRCNNASSPDGTTSWTFVPPFEQDVPFIEPQEQRAAEDARGMSRFKMVIDSLLSEFFVQKRQGDVRSMAERLLNLVSSSMDPEGSCDLRVVGRPVQIPSLCAICMIGDGHGSVNLRPSWVRWKQQMSIDMVLEHIITGMIAVIVDDRAPFGTPRNIAFLAHVMADECVPPHFIHTDKARVVDPRSQPDTPLGNWVQLCASAVGIGSPHRGRTSLTPLRLANNLMLSSEERAQWQHCLDDINPGERFALLLRKHVNMILEHGEELRARNNLLVVPPPRRGSHKRWQAAQIAMQNQRIQHDENFAKLTKGEITESQYRSDERRRAALGHPRDSFAALNLVRFVGELYKVLIVDIHTLRAWIRRLLFDTAYTGVPSMYELEAGCALLITVGAHLDSLGDHEYNTWRGYPPDDDADMLSSNFPIEGLSKAAHVHAERPPNSNPRSRFDSAAGMMSDAALARTTMTSSIERLSEIQTIEEVEEEGRSWCREVIALHGRGWRAMPSTRYMDAISSAGKVARRNRRGGSGYRTHSTPSSDADVPVPASWSDDEVC